MTGFVPFSNLSRLTSFGLSPKPVIKGDLLMARSRNIKPAFFQNEDLVELNYSTRLLFIGLWCLADREGRLENRPKKIKMQLFPADDLDIPKSLLSLGSKNLVTMYSVGCRDYIQINNFLKHQHPHHKEVPSSIPKQGKTRVRLGQDRLIPDSLNPIKTLDQSAIDQEFDKFWLSGIKKVNKKKSKAMFTSILKKTKDQGWSEFTEILIEDVKSRLDSNQLGFSEMHPTTYLNGERWRDEIIDRANDGERSYTLDELGEAFING